MPLLQAAHSGFHGAGRPLIRTSDKGTDFEWTDRRHEAFGQLKNALTSAPILGFPREDGLWYLDTDVSDVGTGGCGDKGVGHGRKWPLPPWTDRGERGQLPGRLGAAVFGRRTSA